MAVDTSGVLAGKTLTQIVVNYRLTCALDTAGAAYCWGANFNGQLGDDSTTSASSRRTTSPPAGTRPAAASS